MIDLYGWNTGNTYRVLIALEEIALPYCRVPVNLRDRAQDTPGFLALNPMGQVPLIIDNDVSEDGKITLAQSMAILLYLANKTGRLLPASDAARTRGLEALSLVMTDLVAPVNFGLSMQRDEDTRAALTYGEARAMRALAALERRLNAERFLGGACFGLADCAAFPMINLLGAERLSKLPATLAWFQRTTKRPAVQRALAITF